LATAEAPLHREHSDLLGPKRIMLLGALFLAVPRFLYPFVANPRFPLFGALALIMVAVSIGVVVLLLGGSRDGGGQRVGCNRRVVKLR
jgi:hypothetical protein